MRTSSIRTPLLMRNRGSARRAVPRVAVHRAVGELHLECARALPSAQEQVRPLVLRGLASQWRASIEAGRTESTLALGFDAIRAAATVEFAEIESLLGAVLPLDRSTLEAIDAVPSDPFVALVPSPADADEMAAFLGAAYEAVLTSPPRSAARVAVHEATSERRRAGAHHTDPRVACDVVTRALESLTRSGAPLRVLDPAMGSGAFLAEVVGFLADALETPRAELVARCIYGVDNDPIAVDLARIALACLGGWTRDVARAVRDNLVLADFVVRSEAEGFAVASTPLSPATAFPDVCGAGEGFDAIVGNPPWIAFAGRAAQPIDSRLSAYLRKTCPAFAGYRTLHGVFVERAVGLLRPGGRLGFVLPTSVADLDGYAPVRRAHDALAAADRPLPDYGPDAFEGVFQPAMALLSTRRDARVVAAGDAWEIERGDRDEVIDSILARCEGAAVVPSACFGERGLQTSGGDRAQLARRPDPRRSLGLRCGADIAPFRTMEPTYWLAREDFGSKLRTDQAWSDVGVYVRQTARFPIASAADGAPFRNSILAGFGVGKVTASFLLAYLNSSVVRFMHYQRFRDARQGMPQLKIGHLRKLPLPHTTDLFLNDVARVGERLARANVGIDAAEQSALDAMVATAWDLTSVESDRVEAWSRGDGRLPAERSRSRHKA